MTMELKTGYKQTEIGVIPIDWEVRTLSEIADIATGTTPPTNNRNNYGDEYFFVSPADLGYGKYILDTEKKLSKLGFNVSRKYPANSILFTCIGSTIGKSGISKIELTSNQQINAILPNNSFSSDFVFYYLNLISPKIKSGASEQAVPMINKTEFAKTTITLPNSLKEQTAIANALSDADGLITGLEKLIAKKRNIKQGAMQQLFQPKEGWEVKKLGELIEILADYTANGSFESLKNNVTYYSIRNYAVLVRTTDLDKPVFEPERFTDKRGYDFLSKTSLFGGELILANVGSVGKVFKVPYFNMYMTLAPNTYMIKFFKHISLDFIYQWMQTKEFNKKLLSKIGSTTLLAINKDNLREIIINIPIDLKEQTRIATILSDMDAELSALEQKLEKYKKVKLGMMQELLTGKTRLV